MNSRIVFCIVLTAIFQKTTHSAVQNVEGSAQINGIVLNQISKEPLSGVRLTLTGQRQMSKTVVSEQSGKFAFQGLAGGQYRLSLSKSGFAEPSRARGPRNLTLTAMEDIKNLQLTLVPTAAMSGTVLDENLKPLQNVYVVAFRPQYANGTRTVVLGGQTSSNIYRSPGEDSTLIVSTPVNERGEFRLSGLEAGSYYVAATSKDHYAREPDMLADPEALPLTFYPGSPDFDLATPIEIKDGDDISGVTIRKAPRKMFTAQIKVFPPRSGAIADCFIDLKAFLLVQHVPGLDIVRMSQSGRDPFVGFELKEPDTWGSPALPRGTYDVFYSSCGLVPGMVGKLNFSIADHDIEAGSLIVDLPLSIKGRVKAAAGIKLSYKDLKLRLRPLDARGFVPAFAPQAIPRSNSRFGLINENGEFTFESPRGGDVAPGRYMVDLDGLPDNTYVAEIHYSGRDGLEDGIQVDAGTPGILEVTVGGPGGVVRGMVNTSQNEPAMDCFVALIPQGNMEVILSLPLITTSDQNGAFSFQGIRPGNYQVYAWERLPEAGAYQNRQFLEKYRSQSAPVSVKEASNNEVRLRLPMEPK